MRNPLHTIAQAYFECRLPARSPRWPAARKAWLAVQPACAACGSIKDLEVHHKRPFHLFPQLELDPANFITLCETFGTVHHLDVGHSFAGKRSWKIFNPNVETDAAALYADLNDSDSSGRSGVPAAIPR